jgi:hypothetical protein
MTSHDWLKKSKRPELLEEFTDAIAGDKGFEKLWLHQLACLLLVDVYGRFMLHVDMGGGKALPNDEIVLTPTGWVRIDALRKGDLVIGSNGKPTKVLGVFPQGERPIYNVIFSDGASVRSSDDHLWAVTTPTRKWRGAPNNLKTTKQLRNDLRDTNGWRKWFIPLVEPIDFKSNKTELPLDPYILGLWLGDGHRSGYAFTSADDEVLEAIKTALPADHELFVSKDRNSKASTLRVRKKLRKYGNNWLREKLIRLGLAGKYSHERFIPKTYLCAPIADRIALLQGLMDSDGYVTTNGKCNYASSSKMLADDFVYLARSLGGTATCRGFRPNTKKGHYAIYANFPKSITPCRLTRKLERLNGTRKRRYGVTRAITAISRNGKAPCTCISVAASDGLFVTKDFILTHNTSITLFSILARKLRGEKPKAVVFVPYVTAVDTWIEECKKRTPQLKLVPLIGSTTDNQRQLAEADGEIYVICYASAVAMLAEPAVNRKGKSGWNIDPKNTRKVFDGFDMIVLDEIHKCSNISTLTYRMCRAISFECKYGIGLSGTPFGKNVEDIWSQFYLVDFGETLGETKGLFMEAFFKKEKNFWNKNRFANEYKFDKSKMPLLKKMVKHSSIHYDASEMHDLPVRRYIPRRLRLPPDIEEYVHIAAQKFIEAVKSKDTSNRFRLAEASYMQLRQLASGFMTVNGDSEKIKIAFDSNPKLDLLEEYIDGMPRGCKMVVFHHFIYTNELISQRLTKLKVGHARIWSGQRNILKELQRFRDDVKCRVLVINDQSGSNSLNLQHANYMFFFEEPDSPINRQQGERRIWRPGQTQPVYYIDPFMDGTVDERIFYSNQQGKKLLDSLLKGDQRL